MINDNPNDIILKPGDIFCVQSPMLFGKIIVFIEKINSTDNEAKYGHSGIILDSDGTTFEALWTNKKQNLFEKYAGYNILIGRHRDMTEETFQKGWDKVRHHEGQWYAGHRLLFFFVPFVAKYLNLGLGVCSELTAKFLCHSGVIEDLYWKGKNPDHIADMIHKWKGWEIVFEGGL